MPLKRWSIIQAGKPSPLPRFGLSSAEKGELMRIIEFDPLSAKRTNDPNHLWRTRLEKTFRIKWNMSAAMAVNNGTAALHSCLSGLDVQRGDEVILSPLICYSDITPIFQQSAIPIFSDIDPRTLSMTAEGIEASITPKTSAVIVAHLYGLPAEIADIHRVCRSYGVPLIEDCVHVPGMKIGNKLAGSFGDCSIFSFGREKVLEAGTGGMILTRKKRLARTISFIRAGGRVAFHKYWPGGANYSLTEVQSYLVLLALKRLSKNIQSRRRRAHIFFNQSLPKWIKPFNDSTDPFPTVALFESAKDSHKLCHILQQNHVPAKGVYLPQNLSNIFTSPSLLRKAFQGDKKLYKSYIQRKRPVPIAEKSFKHLFYFDTSPHIPLVEIEKIARDFAHHVKRF